jgi:transcription elongation factor GreA
MADQPVVLMTQQGYDELVIELAELKDQKLPIAIDRVATARSFGDLSENSEYHASREDLSVLEGRIEELETLIQNAQIANGQTSGQVSIGSQVMVQIDGKKDQHVFHIVGEWEADPMQKKISEKSPLGQALAGKKVGDVVEVEVPAGKLKYVIKQIK